MSSLFYPKVNPCELNRYQVFNISHQNNPSNTHETIDLRLLEHRNSLVYNLSHDRETKDTNYLRSNTFHNDCTLFKKVGTLAFSLNTIRRFDSKQVYRSRV